MEISARPRPRRLRRLAAGLAVCAIALSVAQLAPAALGLRQRAIADEAMQGAVDRGSLVLESHVHGGGQLRVGDVISFVAPEAGAGQVTRRVVSHDGLEILTRGDALPAADAWTLRASQLDVQRVVIVVPYAGIPQLLVPFLTWPMVALLLAAGSVVGFGLAGRRTPGRHRAGRSAPVVLPVAGGGAPALETVAESPRRPMADLPMSPV